MDELRVIIKNNEETKVIFAAVDEDYCFSEQKEVDGIHYFPTEESLRIFKLGRNNVIHLNEIADKDCKKCNGTGKVGARVLPTTTEKEISDVLYNNWENKQLARHLIVMMRIPLDFSQPLGILLDVAHNELTQDNRKELAEKYARIIKTDFEFKEIVWCKCFITNLQKAVDETLRNVKFSIN